MAGFKSPTTTYVDDIQSLKKFVKICQVQWFYGVFITAELSLYGDQKEVKIIFQQAYPTYQQAILNLVVLLDINIYLCIYNLKI